MADEVGVRLAVQNRSQFTRDVDSASKSVQGFGKSAAEQTRSLKAVSQSAGQFASKMKYASGIAGLGLLYAADKASDLNEALNVTGLVFGTARREIDEFAESAASSIGQSERAAREATATFGGLLKNLGLAQDETVKWSMDLTVLASDLASAFNTDPADAVQAIGAALRGETEPIRRYNVMLDDATVRAQAVKMGLASTTAEVDKAGKAQAALALIMKQTSDVQGDFANTADGAANAQRIAAAEAEDAAASFGRALAPILGKVAQLAGKAGDAFASMPEPLQTGAVGLVALAFAAAPAAKAIQGITLAVEFLTVAQTGGIVAMTGFQVALGRLGLALLNPATGIIAAVAAGVLVLRQFNDESRSFGSHLDEFVAEQGGWERVMGKQVDATAEAAHHTRLLQIEEDRLSKETEKASRKLVNFAGLTREEFKEWRASTVDSLGAVEDRIDTLADKAHVDAGRIIRSFNRQIENQLAYEKNWAKVVLRADGRSDSLLQHLQELGLGGANVVSALASANKDEFSKIINDWERSQRIAERTSRIIQNEMGGAKSGVQGVSGAVADLSQSWEDLLASFANRQISPSLLFSAIPETTTEGDGSSKDRKKRGGSGGDTTAAPTVPRTTSAQPLVVPVYIGRREIARAVVDDIHDRKARK